MSRTEFAKPYPAPISTGIVALDFALGGGLRMPLNVAIIGAPGSGKTTLLRRIADAVKVVPSIDACLEETLVKAVARDLEHAPIVLLDGDFAIRPLDWWETAKLRHDRLLIACVHVGDTTVSKVVSARTRRRGPVIAHEFDVVLWIRTVTTAELRISNGEPGRRFTVVKVLKNRFGPVDMQVAI